MTFFLQTVKIQGVLRLTSETTVTASDEGGANLTVMASGARNTAEGGAAGRTNNSDGSGGRQMVLQAREPGERDRWVAAIQAAINALSGASGEAGAGVDGVAAGNLLDSSSEEVYFRGYLATRPPRGGDNWGENYFVLTISRIECYEEEHSVEPSQVFNITPNCSVFETNLKAHAFELVTSQKVLHVKGRNADDTANWIGALRSAINASQPEREDPVARAAQEIEDEFYDVVFETKKPLGVVLERSAEWAIVKLSNPEETGVSVGSALTEINGKTVVLNGYMDTIKALTGWQPPLRLGFRRAPKKMGVLNKLARARRGKVKNWKTRYFVLSEGRLCYYSKEGDSGELKGEVQLMGSAVALVPHSETGQYFCFRLVSGVTSLTMQALTVDDMMDWASMLYHAITIANGGGYLLDLERAKQQQEEADNARSAAAKAAEEELAERKKAEAEAAAAAAEAAEAERRAAAERLAHDTEEAKRKEAEAAQAAREAEEKRAREEAEAAEAQQRAEALAEAEETARLEKEYREEQERLKREAKEAEERENAEEFHPWEEMEQASLETGGAAAATTAVPDAIPIAVTAQVDSEQTPPSRSSRSSRGRRKSLIETAAENTAEGEAAAIAARDIAASQAQEGGEEESDDDEDDIGNENENEGSGEAQEEKAAVAEGSASPGSSRKSMSDDSHWDGIVLTAEMVDTAFVALDTSGTGFLNPMAFSKVIRTFAGAEHRDNMYTEMMLFSRFNTSSDGAIDKDEFHAGFLALQDAGEHAELVRGIKKFASGHATCL